VSKGEWDMMLGTEISYPVPAENTFHADNDIIEKRENQVKEQFRISFDVFVNHDFSFVAENADIHFPGMQIDAAVILVLIVVEFHFASFFVKGF
jgi:hypothetical protein